MKKNTDAPESSMWPLTDWSEVGHAARPAERDIAALNSLVLKYRVPLETHLRWRFPTLAKEAEEIVQDFSEDKVLRDGWLSRADRKRGHFRAFLKTSLDNFVKDRLRKNANPPVSLDNLEREPEAEPEHSAPFDIEWAQVIVDEALGRMEADCKAPEKHHPNRSKIWDVFWLRFARPMIEEVEPLDYKELISQYQIMSPAEAQNLLATGKRMFRKHVDSVVKEYEDNEGAAREEVESIRKFLVTIAGKAKKRAARCARCEAPKRKSSMMI